MATSKKPKLAPIQVFVRIRPSLERDGPSAIKKCTSKDISIKGHTKNFSFDHIFEDKAGQVEVYKTVVSRMVGDIMKGYNCTIFAYGQTGTGKTHTILGNIDTTIIDNNLNWEQESNAGIIQRAAVHLYEQLGKMDQNIQRTVTVSFMEIYNEEIRDLLCDKELVPLRIYEDKSKLVHVQNLQEVTVLDPQEILYLLKKGCDKRQVASTLMNNHSSRSHTVFTITVSTIQTISVAGNVSNIICGKLNLIDLAGSESIAKSGSKEQRAREASNINQSLLTLGRVIKALVDNSSHIPYRESKLTRILQDSLGGKAKTSIIATISPGIYSLDETLNTLDYAYNARNVTNCPMINLRTSANAAAVVETLNKLKRELFEAANAKGLYMDKDNYDEMTKSLTQFEKEILLKHDTIRILSEQVEDLIAQKEEWEKLRVSFEITRQRYQELQNENLINRNKIENDSLLLNYYETESGKLQEYVDMMKQKENHLHQKVDTLYAASANNHKVIESIIRTVDSTMDKLLQESDQNCKHVAENISHLVEFNDKVCRMFNNVRNELTDKSKKRHEVADYNNISSESDDPFSLHIINLHKSLNLIETQYKEYLNCCNNKIQEISQQVTSIKTCRLDMDTILREFEKITLDKVLDKENETNKLWNEFEQSSCKFNSQHIERQNALDIFLEEEYNDILKERERLNEREQRYLNMKKSREASNINKKIEEYTQMRLDTRPEMCDFTDLKQNAGSFCSAIQNIRNIENETFENLQRQNPIDEPEEIMHNLKTMRNEIVKSVCCLLNKNNETASVLDQISSILDVEGKAHLAELKQVVSSHSELVNNACRDTNLNVRRIYNSSVEPVTRTGHTPQRTDFQFPTRRSTRNSLLRKLANSSSDVNGEPSDPE